MGNSFFCPILKSRNGWDIPSLLQEGWMFVVPFLVQICCAFVVTGCVLAIWGQVKVVFIPKPGCNSYSGRRDFRPINLTLFLLKDHGEAGR
jgi:hypothetical protein